MPVRAARGRERQRAQSVLRFSTLVASLLVIYCAFPETGTKFGVEVCHVLEYDTEQQVLGNHLLCAWETLEEARESSRKAHTRLSV